LCSALLSLPAAITEKDITDLKKKLTDSSKSSSSARKKLAIRRVIREAEGILKENASADNRYEILHVLYKSQQALVSLDKSSTNRKAFLETCKLLAKAPNKYAGLRLDADLLLTQAEAARNGGDAAARANALRPLVERYKDTDVEPKVLRIAMLLALEYGNTQLVNDLRGVIAKRSPGDMELIKFQRDKLTTQVFGAPLIADFIRSDGQKVKAPMDFMGQTIMLYFWSAKDMEDLKGYAEAWKKVKAENKIMPEGRFRIVSVNMDNLPDCGESTLKELGVDWMALKLPKGKESEFYKIYVRTGTPKALSISPSGYTALHQSGWRSDRTQERLLGSRMARSWVAPRYCSQLQSLFAADFLVIDPTGEIDPTAPPELKAVNGSKLSRSSASVPEAKLKAIQECFVAPPFRYRLAHAELVANYKKAADLCRETISAHASAPDLWIVRNRRIIALMGLWKTGDDKAFAEAVKEANAAIKAGYPKGTDVIAQLCLTREALRSAENPQTFVKEFIKSRGGYDASAPDLAAGALLALEVCDRLSYERYRQAILEKHANNPMMWTVTAFLLERFHQYWLFHPPFTAGWTYGRRQDYFLAVGNPEEANRRLEMELKTLDGKVVKFPEASEGKWTVIYFTQNKEMNRHYREMDQISQSRPFQDVNFITAVIDGNASSDSESKKKKIPKSSFPTLMVPGGLKNPIVQKLGIMDEDLRHNIVILKPDGKIVLAASGLTMKSHKGQIVKNVIEWQDEKSIDDALKAGKIEEAKRLIFALAPIVNPDPKKKNVKIPVPYLRSRAKVYMAMGNLEAAKADAEKAYLEANIKGGHISMRTEDLDRAEALKAKIAEALNKE